MSMGRAAGVIAVVIVGLLAVVPAVGGAVSARLEGRFEVDVKVTASSFSAPGAEQSRIYRFTPLCDEGACRKVTLRREIRKGKFVRSELHRVSPGIYEAVEVQRDITCRGGPSGAARTVRIHLEVLGREGGEATRIKGRLFAQTQGCPEKETQRAKFTGRR